MLALTGCDSGDENSTVNLNDKVSDEELAQHSANQTAGTVFQFGFDLRSSPQEDARQLLPFLAYLERATGYQFELRFTPENQSTATLLGTGEVQFAAIGATSYIRANEKYGVTPLVRGKNLEGKSEYRSIIVVAPDSPIQTLQDLRGRRFAFGSVDSTQGHLIPRIVLSSNNIELKDLAAYSYTGSHRNCVAAVVNGEFDACGMQDTMALDFVRQGLVRILHISKYYPSSGISANRNVPPEVLAKVKQALLDFDPEGRDREGLYHWQQTEMPKGFIAATDADYDELREWIFKLSFVMKISTSDVLGGGA